MQGACLCYSLVSHYAFSFFWKYFILDVRHNADDPVLAGLDLLLSLIDVELFWYHNLVHSGPTTLLGT